MAAVVVSEIVGSTTVIEQTKSSTVVIGPLLETGAFTELTDTPSSLVGQGGKAVVVKTDGSGLEFLELVGVIGDKEVTYTEITWANGLPSLIEKYENSSKLLKLFTITPVFVDGLPSTITTVDHVKLTTELTTLVFTNGELTSVVKTLL